MQVLPRVYSAAEDGSDEREFLMDFFKTPAEMLSKLFLKGYQWPFDVRKVAGGSSIIDVLVYLERCKGRRVYLDYHRNPVGGAFSYDELEPEARDYLTRAGACFGTPSRASWPHERSGRGILPGQRRGASVSLLRSRCARNTITAASPSTAGGRRM
ncbi:MAG: hypothetical protein V8T36_04780 [Ruthenibacterium lactatiformans]